MRSYRTPNYVVAEQIVVEQSAPPSGSWEEGGLLFASSNLTNNIINDIKLANCHRMFFFRRLGSRNGSSN